MSHAQTLTSDAMPRRMALNITLWILQVILALMFLTAGVQKAFGNLQEVVKSIFWVLSLPAPMVRFIGISELMGAIGLVLPAALRIRTQLTTLAATGLSLIMLGANIFHISRGEFFVLPMTLTLLVLSAFIAYGRWKLVPIKPKIIN